MRWCNVALTRGLRVLLSHQGRILPHTLNGNDAIGKAQTGTGKTAAFLITIFNDLLSHPIEGERYLGEPRAVIIAPTRELVMQSRRTPRSWGDSRD